MVHARKSKNVLCLLMALLGLSLFAEDAKAQGYDCQLNYWFSHAPGAPQSEWELIAIDRICLFRPRGPAIYMRQDGAGESAAGNTVTAARMSSRIEDAQQTSCEATDRPVVISGGIKVLPELDFQAGDVTSFGLARVYGSTSPIAGAFGANWASSIDYGLVFEYGTTQCVATLHATTTCATTPTGLTKVFVRRPGGGRASLTLVGGSWKDGAGRFELTPQGAGWVLWTQEGEIETYNAAGQPLSTRDEGGIGLNFAYDGAGKLTNVGHTSGRSMALTWTNQKVTNVLAPDAKNYAFAYSAQGYLQTVTLPDGLGQKTYHYEVAGQPWLLTGVSVDGVRKTRYRYFADGRVMESGDEDGGHKSTFSYGTNVTNVTNALGQTTAYQLSSTGLISQVNRPASAACAAGVRTTQHDSQGRVVLEVDGSGNRTRYAYTPEGRLQQKSVGETASGDISQQRITVYVWNAAQTRLDAIREYGPTVSAGDFIQEITYAYYPDGDGGGRARLPQSVTVYDRTAAAAAPRTVSYDYSFHGNKQISQRWADGPLPGTVDRTTTQFDSLGNVTQLINPLGQTITYSNHTALGQPGRVTDANGLVSDVVYDAKGRVTRTTVMAPGGPRITQYAYDARDNMISTTDPSGRVVEARYNLAGEMTQISAPAAFPLGQTPKDVRNIGYNGLGQVIGENTLQSYLEEVITGWQGGEPIMNWVVKSKSFSTRTWAYDAGGFLSNAQGNNGQNVRYAYNASGDVASVTDSLNRVSTTTYDAQGRVKTVTAPNNGVASFEYSPLGWLTKVTDRNGNVTRYEYNGHGDVTRVISPDSGITQYTHDAAGKVATVTRADGTVTYYSRDALGRVTQASATWPGYSGIPGTQNQFFVYDSCSMGAGRICSVSDDTGTTSYTYRQSGELASQTSTIAGVSFGLTFAHDAFGRLSTATYPNGVVLRYSYSGDHRVSRIEAMIGGVWRNVVTNAAYQPFGGPLIGLMHGNGWNRQLDYDQDGRVTKIYGAGTTHPQSLTYGYNANDLITGITNAKNTAASQTYGYDVMSAVTSAFASSTGQHTWQYDANGNRLSHAWGAGTDTYATTPGTNRIASLAGPRSRSAMYDPNGNLRHETRGGISVERRYNGFNRQVKLIRPTAQSLAQPNGVTLGLPAGTWDYGYNALGQRATKTQVGGNTTRYLFSPGSLLLGETNPNSATLDTIYVWLEGKPVGVIRGGQLFAVHTDHLGRPEVATNASKTVVWRASNHAFDRTVTADSMGGLSLGFPGQQYDAEAATWYNVFRDYDASTGRYSTSDPIGLAGGSNTYAYVRGNAPNAFDSLGLETCVLTTTTNGIEDHAALYIARGGSEGNPLLYDPNGLYSRSNGGGSGDVVEGEVASIEAFTEFHSESTVNKECKQTSLAEEQRLSAQVMKAPTSGFLGCAVSVSNVIFQSGYFPFVDPDTFWPSDLREAAGK
jgi:RHS repeat-associated protein